MMNKRLQKQITAIVIAYALVTSTAGNNIVFAAENEESIAIVYQQENTDNIIEGESNITGNIKLKERTPELDRISNECKEVKADGNSAEIRKGQMVSVKSVLNGYDTNAAIMENGDLYCWGNNGVGQVGNGTTEDQTTPVKVLSNVKFVFCFSSRFLLAIMENGDLYCWGHNNYGQIGNGTTEIQTKPVKILSNVKSVSYCLNYVVSAITENGDLYCWGSNSHGQVGNGTTKIQTTPVKVLSNVKSVSCSAEFMSAITENGDLYCWGYNGDGQIGNGTTEDQTTPVKVLSDVESVFYSVIHDDGGYSVSAITTNGDLYCWGDNSYGQIGNNGNTKKQTIPVQVLSNVKSVYYSYSDYCSVSAITTDGDLYCWGNNNYGQAGNGTTENQTVPVKVLSNVKSVSYSNSIYYTSVSAIMENGDLYCWGHNGYGEVGNGITADQTIPVKVLSGVKSVCYSACFVSNPFISVSAITENGDLYCWGINFSGQIENWRVPMKVLSDVKSVSYSYCGDSVSAITENGDLYCWGNNDDGQIGNGTTEDQAIPVKILSDVEFVSSSCWRNSISAITTKGDLYCWGYNHYGQAGNGTTETQTTPVKVLFDTSPDETSINISDVTIADTYYNVNDQFSVYVEYMADETLINEQRKNLILEVVNTEDGTIVASGTGNDSDNYFSIPKCNNIESGKNYTLEFSIKYKDYITGEETELWKETRKIGFEEQNAWTPHKYIPAGQSNYSLQLNIITNEINYDSIIDGIYLFDKNGNAVAGNINNYVSKPMGRYLADSRYNGVFSQNPPFDKINGCFFYTDIYYGRKLDTGEELYAGYSVDGKLKELKDVKFIVTDRPYIKGIYKNTDVYPGMEDYSVIEVTGYNIDFSKLSFILKEQGTGKVTGTVASSMIESDSKAYYVIKWGNNYKPLDDVKYNVEFVYEENGTELINELAGNMLYYNTKSNNIIWNPKENSIEYYNEDISAGTDISYEIWNGSKDNGNSECCASGKGIIASNGYTIKIHLEDTFKNTDTGNHYIEYDNYIEYLNSYYLYLTYKDGEGTQKEISDGIYIYGNKEKEIDKPSGEEGYKIYAQSLRRRYFLSGSKEIELSAQLYCNDTSKLADRCDAVIYNENDGSITDNIELVLNNDGSSLSYDLKYNKELPVGRYRFSISPDGNKKLNYYFYVIDNSSLYINSQTNNIDTGLINVGFGYPELADLYYNNEYLKKIEVKICDIQKKEIGTYNYLTGFTITNKNGLWEIQLKDKIREELAGFYCCYVYIYYNGKEVETEYYDYNNDTFKYQSIYKYHPLIARYYKYKKDKNNWIGMCYGNGKEYINISNNKNNDRYYIPQTIPDGSGNTGSIGAYVPSSYYYFQSISPDLNFRNFYGNGKFTCNSVYGYESAFPAVLEITDWYSLKTLKKITIPKNGYYLTASDLSGLNTTGIYNCYLKGADGSVNSYFGYMDSGKNIQEPSPVPSPTQPSGSGSSAGGGVAGGGGAPSATKIPENSKEPEITKAPETTKAPGNNNEPGEPDNTDGSVPEDTDNNQPVNADTTGDDKGQGSTTATSKGKLVLKRTKLTLKPGQKSKIKITSKINTKVTYKSLNPSIAIVSKKGVITARKAGKAVITVKANGKKRKVTVTVKKTKVNANSSVIVTLNKSLKLSKTAVSIKKGKKFTIKKASGIKGKVKFVSANKKIASVSVNGVVKAKKKGKTTILIKTAKKTVKLKITVTR